MDKNDLVLFRTIERELTLKIVFLHNVLGDLQNAVRNIGNVLPGFDHRMRKLEGRELIFDESEDGTLILKAVDPPKENVVQFPSEVKTDEETRPSEV